jgi:hypothetical protein
LVVRAPDGVADQSRLFVAEPLYSQAYGDSQPLYMDNSTFLTVLKNNKTHIDSIGLKDDDGNWKMIAEGMTFWGLWGDNPQWLQTSPDGIFGDVLCRPIPADYDGDGLDDRAVQCGNDWVIAYSASPGTSRNIQLDTALDPLPAFVYAGGVKYQEIVDLYNYYKSSLGCPKGANCTIFDAPPPVGPYFAECLKYWAPNPAACWNK